MPRKTSSLTSLPSGVITAMFTDIVDSTRIKSQMEGETSGRRDTKFRQEIKEPHDAVVLSCVREAGGYVVNPTGDGFCITFVDAEEAVLCALRIQKHFAEHQIATPSGPLQIRIGLHTGIAGASGDDYIASTVDKTARVQSQAAGGQVFVSHQTQVLVSDRTRGVQFKPRGIFDLKGLQAEELYQAIALPELHLPPVNMDTAHIDSQHRPEVSKPSSMNRGIIAAIVLCVLAVAVGAGVMLRKTPQEKPKPVSVLLPAGSDWNGTFRFLPPMGSYEGSIAIHVTKRSSDTFEATYATENAAYQWLIAGTVKGGKLRWEFIKPIKNPGSEDAVGKAFGEANVEGRRMQGFFRMKANVKEAAALDLRRTD